MLRAELAAYEVVGGDVAGGHFGFEGGIDNHDGDAGADGAFGGGDEGSVIEWGEDHAVDALRNEVFDDLDLLLAVVLAEGAFPDDFDGLAFGFEFLLGFERAGVDGFPEFVAGAFGDNGDVEGFGGAKGESGENGASERACEEALQWIHAWIVEEEGKRVQSF